MDSKLALAQKQSSDTSDAGAATASNKSSSSTAFSTSSIASSTEDSSLDTKQQNDNSGSGDEVKTKEDMWVETRVIRDANAVLDMMKPRSAASRVLAINISKHISADLEHRLNATSKYAIFDTCITLPALDELVPYSNNRQRPLFDTAAYAKKKYERSGTTANAFAVFQEWISPRPIQQQPIGSPSAPLESMHGDDTDDAKQIHTSVQSFVYFVSQHIDCFISALDPCTFAKPPLCISPCPAMRDSRL
ncbi:hypothetical protein DL89DRAFT_288690 [Linderina pennispora]|uniref:Uncharacterized protein n=1 Tax=Linderina pennispora TaxID=61395 RepID=A0A1Y1VRX0_9FUNG|nr:uncharacterized protein DL89DRAFT_288690 [Linderina pennispora]ORX64007.1 hypothetical protein DL89DRAFT_288690 [Linderina pennispora]